MQTGKIKNKIISVETLNDIFYMLNDKLNYYLDIYRKEEFKNRIFDSDKQFWTFKDSGSKLTFNVYFKDNSKIQFEKFENFISMFQMKLQEIETINVHLELNYWVRNDYSKNLYSQTLNLSIREDDFEYRVNLNNNDDKLKDVFEYINKKVNAAPERYDFTIENKNKIIQSTGFAIGFIPSFILSVLFMFIPMMRDVFKESIILFPLIVISFTYFIGSLIGSSMYSDLYKNIKPKRVYTSYNERNLNKYDIDNFVNRSEVLIGKNINNDKCRKEIKEKFEKYKKFIPKEIVALIITTITTIFI